MREVASKQHDAAGDGTTTASVLASSIAREGAKAAAAGLNPMGLKRGIDLAVEAIVADLKKNSKKVSSNDEIAPMRRSLDETTARPWGRPRAFFMSASRNAVRRVLPGCSAHHASLLP